MQYYLLKEDGDYLLQENEDKLILEEAFAGELTAKGSIFTTVVRTIVARGRVQGQLISAKGSIVSRLETIQAKAKILITYFQFVTAKARIYGAFPTTRSINARAKINPSQAFIDEVNKTVRQISSKLEIQWDGAIWTDETAYFISAGANEKMSTLRGEGIAATLDVELENTTERFTPDNTTSPIYSYIKPRVKIRVSIVMGGYTYRLFTGYIKNIHPDTRSRVCNLECFDNQVSVYNKVANGIVYVDKRTDQLLTTLTELAGLDEDQFDFDIGTTIVNFGYFEDRNVWPIMGEIAVAERGRVFFDRKGILRFWNRDSLHNQHAVTSLTLSDNIIDLDYSVAEHEMKNKVVVQAIPRASAGIQQVWSSGNAAYLNPYTDTLVYVPAKSTQLAFLELEDPCTTFITPIPNTDYTANSAQDGSGDDLTNSIVINEFINYGDSIFIGVLNIGDTDAYLTKFQIRGNPAKVLKWIRVTATDDQSINAYGIQEFKIENNFISSEGVATEIAEEELYRRKDAINLFRTTIIGIPYLLCGDVIDVEYRAGESRSSMISELNWSLDAGGFMQKLTFVNPYIFPNRKTVDVRANIVSALKTTLAKGDIKLTTTRTITSKGEIT